MKRFNYKAREKSTGKIIKGSIQADNERTAGKLLVEKGYIPESIVDEEAGNIFSKFTNKVKSKDRIVFTRQFATLIGAGLPLAASLRTVAEQTQSKPMRGVIEEMLAGVESGKSLHEMVEKRPDVFNNVYKSLIAAGEMSGTLDMALKRLADQEEKNEATMSKIKGAMIYPLILLVVIMAVLVFMLIEVVPQVQSLYDTMGEELPDLTKFLVGAEDFFINYWWLAIILAGGAVTGIVVFLRTPTGKKFLDTLKIKVPLFGPLFRKLYVARFARTSETLLATGVAMIDSVQIASNAVSNIIVEEEYMKAIEMIKGGKPLSEALKDREYMLPLVPQMASIGEQSGKIDEMLGKAAQVYENELDEQIDNISTLIEPILLVVMAGMVGVVLAGTLLPIYSLVNKIN